MRTREEIDAEYTRVCMEYGHFKAQALLRELEFTATFVRLQAEMAKREEVDAAVAALAAVPVPPPSPAGGPAVAAAPPPSPPPARDPLS